MVHLSETRKKIADTLMSCKSGRMTPAELATATGLTRAVIDKRLAGMVEEGPAIKLARLPTLTPIECPIDQYILGQYRQNERK